MMVAANMSGTIKKLLIIGKSKNSKCFKNVRSLPVDYESNRKAWMTSDIFIKWVRNCDREEKILLLVENCPSPNLRLEKHNFHFLPPNTSVLQPMDQGIIRALESNFRKNVILKLVASLDANEDTSSAKHPKITILDAILMIYDVWNKLKSTTVFNCYKHAGFVRGGPGIADSISVAADNNDDDVPLSVWARALKEELPIENEKLDQYYSVDDDIATCEEPTDENILQNII
ncbi:hypothetical protein HHI36_001026 [Cryptolaemus montrouzieri]|uniref:DDE-1 domain-containing protein n=1 Tax=Cryptolaemus montrouzieri TaxID=559131 RepID=A0ABD2P6U5_9CUCU